MGEGRNGDKFDREKYLECKQAIEDLIEAANQTIKDKLICDQDVADALKDLGWAIKTADRLLVKVLADFS